MNKDLKYYLGLPYEATIEKRSGKNSSYYIARIQELPHCQIHGGSAQEALNELESVKKDWLEDCIERGIPIPEVKV